MFAAKARDLGFRSPLHGYAHFYSLIIPMLRACAYSPNRYAVKRENWRFSGADMQRTGKLDFRLTTWKIRRNQASNGDVGEGDQKVAPP